MIKKIIAYILLISLLMTNVFAESAVGLNRKAAGTDKEPEEKVTEKLTGGRESKEIIVKYKSDNKTIDTKEILKNEKVKEIKSKKRLGKKTEVFEIGNTDDIFTAMEVLQSNPDVDYVQPNYEVSLFSSGEPYQHLQWGIENSGQNINGITGTQGVDVNISPIYEENPTLNEVLVAVIDSGMETAHEELQDKIYVNTNEKADGKDNDGNGFVDDVNGWNFVSGNNDVTDAGGHGTQVAGIIAAGINNKGIAGVARNVKILPLKVFDNGIGYTSDIIEAITYAQSMGAKVANCSFGCTYHNFALYDVIHNSSMMFVCAAGNTGGIADIYPAAYGLGNIISVTSADNCGSLAPNASYGQSVDIVAPGMDIYTTTTGNTYTYVNGASFAAAFASGAAAVLYGARADLNAGEAVYVLKKGSRKLPSLDGHIKTGAMLDIYASYGMVKGNQPIVIEPDEESDALVYSEKILQILEKQMYNALSEDEKETLCSFFSVSNELMDECDRSGYALADCINYAAKMGKFGFTLSGVVALYGRYESPVEPEMEFEYLRQLIESYNISESDYNDVKELVISGYPAGKLVSVYTISKALDIPLKSIVKKDSITEVDYYTNLNISGFDSGELSKVWEYSIVAWLDISVLTEYMKENNISYNGLLHKVNMYKINVFTPLAGSTPKKYPDAPYSRLNIHPCNWK